jgi:hypothetical protein
VKQVRQDRASRDSDCNPLIRSGVVFNIMGLMQERVICRLARRGALHKLPAPMRPRPPAIRFFQQI